MSQELGCGVLSMQQGATLSLSKGRGVDSLAGSVWPSRKHAQDRRPWLQPRRHHRLLGRFGPSVVLSSKRERRQHLARCLA